MNFVPPFNLENLVFVFFKLATQSRKEQTGFNICFMISEQHKDKANDIAVLPNWADLLRRDASVSAGLRESFRASLRLMNRSFAVFSGMAKGPAPSGAACL